MKKNPHIDRITYGGRNSRVFKRPSAFSVSLTLAIRLPSDDRNQAQILLRSLFKHSLAFRRAEDLSEGNGEEGVRGAGDLLKVVPRRAARKVEGGGVERVDEVESGWRQALLECWSCWLLGGSKSGVSNCC